MGYFMGFQLQVFIEIVERGVFVNIEVDDPGQNSPRQQSIQSRRDSFLQLLGVEVVRFDPFDEEGQVRVDLEQALEAKLHEARVLGE